MKKPEMPKNVETNVEKAGEKIREDKKAKDIENTEQVSLELNEDDRKDLDIVDKLTAAKDAITLKCLQFKEFKKLDVPECPVGIHNINFRVGKTLGKALDNIPEDVRERVIKELRHSDILHLTKGEDGNYTAGFTYVDKLQLLPDDDLVKMYTAQSETVIKNNLLIAIRTIRGDIIMGD